MAWKVAAPAGTTDTFRVRSDVAAVKLSKASCNCTRTGAEQLPAGMDCTPLVILTRTGGPGSMIWPCEAWVSPAAEADRVGVPALVSEKENRTWDMPAGMVTFELREPQSSSA